MNTASPSRFHATGPEVAAAAPARRLPMPAAPEEHAPRLRAQLPPPRPGLRAVVIIPAKDEADHLPATLAALAAQTSPEGQPLPSGTFEVIVLANNCLDDTAAVVRRQARRWPRLALHVAELCLAVPHAHVGRARRLLMDEAAHRLEAVGHPNGLIVSTDADTCVAPDWLAATQAEIAGGADAVGGRILTPGGGGACALRRTQLRDATYHLLCARLEDLTDPVPADPWPRHHQHFGASLALTVAAYRRVGGLPEQPFLEDEALWQALGRHDLRLRHSPAVRVFTSARQQGRVAVGLSWQLREWASLCLTQCEPLVASPAQLVALWQLRRRLRTSWAACCLADCTDMALLLGLPPASLSAHISSTHTFGQLWSWVQQTRVASGCHLAQMPLSGAVAELRTLLRGAGRRAA